MRERVQNSENKSGLIALSAALSRKFIPSEGSGQLLMSIKEGASARKAANAVITAQRSRPSKNRHVLNTHCLKHKKGIVSV